MKKYPLLLLVIVLLSGFLLQSRLAAQQTNPHSRPAIARIWHGQVSSKRAEEYTKYLNDQGITLIQTIPGNLGVQMFRKPAGDRTEFVVISYWDSVEAIQRFAGKDYEKVHPLPRDPEFLIDPEPLVQHYNVLVNEWK